MGLLHNRTWIMHSMQAYFNPWKLQRKHFPKCYHTSKPLIKAPPNHYSQVWQTLVCSFSPLSALACPLTFLILFNFRLRTPWDKSLTLWFGYTVNYPIHRSWYIAQSDSLTFRIGNSMPTRKLDVQLERPATATAAGRGPWLNSSDTMNQGIGPGPISKRATKANVATTLT